MRYRAFYTLIILAGSLFACNSDSIRDKEFKTAENGIKYRFVQGTADSVGTAKAGDLINLHFKIFYKDSLLESSDDLWGKVDMLLQPSEYKGSVEQALTMMTPGDSAHFLLDAHKFYINSKKKPAPDFIKVGDELKFAVKLHKIYNEEQIEQKKAKKEAKLKQREKEKINAFLKAEAIDTEPTESGLYFVKILAGKGEKPKKGSRVSVHYTGKFTDGRVFDSSRKRDTAFEFVVGDGKVIRAWEEALLKMRQGDRVLIVAPSSTAYGDSGYGRLIPPFTPLVFEIELLSVK